MPRGTDPAEAAAYRAQFLVKMAPPLLLEGATEEARNALREANEVRAASRLGDTVGNA